jgi:nitrite reductase (NO-forming)
MTVRRLAVVLAVVAAAIGITASSVFAASSQAQATTVKVTAFDLGFKLTTKKAKAGKVIFKVTNTGALKHDFQIAGKKTPMLAKGKSATLTVTIKKGKNAYKCTVAGHAAGGMKGTFTGT